MRLALAFPPPWRISIAPDDRVAAVLPGTLVPEAVVTYGPIILAPDEPRRWQSLVAGSDTPKQARTVVGRTLDVTTVNGWALRLLEAEVTSATGDLIEVRMCGFFTFMEHAAAVIARTQTAAKMEQHGKAILAVLRAGRPDWRGVEPACLAHVWDLGSRRPPRPIANEQPHDPAARIAAYERMIEAQPDRVDTHYNLGQARFDEKQFAAALTSFERVVALDPDDVLVLRKLAQCLYALGRDDEGAAMRERLHEAWARSTDARVRMVSEFVFDQFEVNGAPVMAVETLRPRDPAIYTVLAFHAAANRPSVVVETSDHAKATGTPYVIGVIVGGKFRGVATLAKLPPYGELKQKAIELMTTPPTPPA